MLGRFKGEVVSAGITTYEDKKDGGKRKPRFVVKIRCFPTELQKDEEGKVVNPFVREYSTTYVAGENQMYADEAFLRLGYLWQEENFTDFSDITKWNLDAKFEVIVHEEDGVDSKTGEPKGFEKIKSIWEVQSYDIKNAIVKDEIVNIMAGLSIPEGSAANMREKIKANNNGSMPKAGGTAKTTSTSSTASGNYQISNDAHFAADDIPF